MNNIEIVKVLLRHIGESTEQDKALAQGCIILLGDEPKAKQNEKREPKQPKEEKPKVKVDVGKIKACYEAGWPVKLIADEINTSISTVRYHLKKEGLIK